MAKGRFREDWRREWDSNPRGPQGPQALKAHALQKAGDLRLWTHTRRVNPLGPQDARPSSVALSRRGPPLFRSCKAPAGAYLISGSRTRPFEELACQTRSGRAAASWNT